MLWTEVLTAATACAVLRPLLRLELLLVLRLDRRVPVLHIELVEEGEDLGDGDAAGAGRAVPTARAADEPLLPVLLGNPIHKVEVLICELTDTTPLRCLDILLNVLHGAHTAEEKAYLGLVPYPMESPLRGLPAVMSLSPELLYALG